MRCGCAEVGWAYRRGSRAGAPDLHRQTGYRRIAGVQSRREAPQGGPASAARGGWDMAVDPKRHRFTRADYHEMARAGILKADTRVELIDGDIVEMEPKGRLHRACVARLLNDVFVPNLRVTAIVRIQNPIPLGD